jgi:hypothetical protein
MKIGVLEYRDEKFINDVMARLPDSEFVNFGVTDTPLEKIYDVLIDRLSFQNEFFRSIVKMYSLKGTYVINNPFSCSCDDKCLQNQISQRLGIPTPKTVLVPPIYREENYTDVVKDIDWSVFKNFPLVLKPYDGYAWDDVYIVRSPQEIGNLLSASGSNKLFIAQEYLEYDTYLRCFCINKSDILFIEYDPAKRAYLKTELKQIDSLKPQITEWMIKLNEALDYDINTVEWAIKDSNATMIDALNEVPEVLPQSIPPDYYKWIVDKFVECVNDKFGKKNKMIFG